MKMAREGISKACKEPDEAKLYVNFINAQCAGQPGYPVVVKQTCMLSSSFLHAVFMLITKSCCAEIIEPGDLACSCSRSFDGTRNIAR
jgi:hypothetical protein